MIIDIHNHIVAGGELGSYQAGLIASAGFSRQGIARDYRGVDQKGALARP
jgi:hypothetical protein